METYGYLHLGKIVSFDVEKNSYYVQSVALARTSRWGPIPSVVPGLDPGDRVILAATGTSRDNLIIIGKVGAGFPVIGDIPGLSAQLAALVDADEALAAADVLLTAADNALDLRLDTAETLLTTHGTLITANSNNLATHIATFGAHGGVLPVNNQADRDALTGNYQGRPIYRKDYNWIEIYDGTVWRVHGTAIVPTFADLATRITNPRDGQLAITSGTILCWIYGGGVWHPFPRRIGGEFQAGASQTLATGATKLNFTVTLQNFGLTVISNNTFRVPVDGVYSFSGFCKISTPVPNSASLSIGGTTYASPMYSGDDFSSATTDIANGGTRYLAANTDVCVYVYNNDTSRNTNFAALPATFSIWRGA